MVLIKIEDDSESLKDLKEEVMLHMKLLQDRV